MKKNRRRRHQWWRRRGGISVALARAAAASKWLAISGNSGKASARRNGSRQNGKWRKSGVSGENIGISTTSAAQNRNAKSVAWRRGEHRKYEQAIKTAAASAGRANRNLAIRQMARISAENRWRGGKPPRQRRRLEHRQALSKKMKAGMAWRHHEHQQAARQAAASAARRSGIGIINNSGDKAAGGAGSGKAYRRRQLYGKRNGLGNRSSASSWAGGIEGGIKTWRNIISARRQRRQRIAIAAAGGGQANWREMAWREGKSGGINQLAGQ